MLRRFLCWILFLLTLTSMVSACSSTCDKKFGQSTSAYDRVMKNNAIRCGYLMYPPYCMKDPNTGQLSGLFVETMEKLGQKLGLKVIWAEEVGYESLFEGLHSNRYDIFAGGLWPNANRSKMGIFSIPIFYSAVKAYGRANENRFDSSLTSLNTPKVPIAVIDGAMENLIAKEDFPKAKCLSLTHLSPHSQNLLNVITSKADVTFAEPGFVSLFLKTNSNSLKELAPNKPLRIFGNTYVFNRGEFVLKAMIDTVLGEMLNSGEIEKIIKKYEPVPGVFYRVALPYKTASIK